MEAQDFLYSTALALARFAAFSSHALLFGVPVLVLVVFRPTFGVLDETEWDEGRRRLAIRLEGVVRAALVGAVAASATFLLVQSLVVAELRGSDVESGSMLAVLDTTFGRWYAARLPLAIGLAVLLIGRVARWAFEEPRRRPAWWGTWVVGAAALLATASFSGHATVSSPRALALANDFLHLAAVGTWFAGIVTLAVLMPDAWLGKARPTRIRLLSPVIGRFSTTALTAMAVIVVTGTLNTFFNLESPGDFFDTGYGRILGLKLVVFTGVLALGGANHSILLGRLRAAEAAGTDTPARQTIRRTIATELVLALTLMGLSGVLTGAERTRPSQAAAAVEVGDPRT